MPITRYDYVPILKWRQGEYQALLRLNDPVKDRIVPLIEVTPPDFDFETRTPTKTLDEHLVPRLGHELVERFGGRCVPSDENLVG